jgi:restriction endonuclease S subunit
VVDGSTYGSKMPRASWDFIGNLLIPFPDKAEQVRIADFLASKSVEIYAQVARAEKSIELLLEYRTALISEVVTGKIDVRENL